MREELIVSKNVNNEDDLAYEAFANVVKKRMHDHSKHRSVELDLVAEVAKRLSNGGLKPADVQALLEKKPVGESSLDDKIVANFFGYGFTEANFNETIVYYGQLMKRHRNGGGWVPVEQDRYDIDFPYVAPSVYVDVLSVVSGYARVTDFVRILGSSRVADDSKLYGTVCVRDSAVCGDSILAGSTSVIDSCISDCYARDEKIIHSRKISAK